LERLLFPLKRRRHKVGLPPGSVVFVGDAPGAPVEFETITYDEHEAETERPKTVDDALSTWDASGNRTCWLNVTGVHDASVIQNIGDHLNLHPLIQEDIANTGQRPKVEVIGNQLFLVVKMLYVTPEEHSVTSEQLSLLVSESGLVCFQERPGDVFDPVRDRIDTGRVRIRAGGPSYLAYALLDLIVDHYFVVLEQLAAQAETLEDEVLDDPTPQTQERLNHLRRNLALVRRHAWPVREVLSQLERTEESVWPASLHPFVRDAYEHTVQVLDLVESLRDLVGGLMDLYMTSLSNRMNEVMKVLTIIGTIFIPLTFIAGIYGMNFEYMPELSAPYGYPVAMSVMTVIGLLLVYYFRRKDWI
jgi:magnesium transporter